MDLYVSALITMAVIAVMAWQCINSNSVPVNWPVVGMMPFLVWNMDNIYEHAAKHVIDSGGTFRFRGPWMANDLSHVNTCTPDNLEHILKNDFPNFLRGPYLKEVFFSIFGDGLFTADGELWRRQRKAVGIAMGSGSFRDLSSSRLQKLVEEKLMPILEEAKDKRSSLDLQDVFLRFNFDIICSIVLGRDSGCLSPSFPDIPFATAFDEALKACTYRLIVPTFMWKLMRLLNVGFERNLKRSATIIHKCASEMVKARINEIKDMGVVLQGDILSNFIKMEAEKGRSPSEKLLQDLVLSTFLAGRDTSSLSLGWFFWLLSMHPQVEENILSELSTIPNFSQHKYFRAEEVRGMNYLQASLSEGLRLYPSVPFILREAAQDNVLPDGTFVKKNSKLLCFVYATNRMETVWGKDAQVFRPERWINKDGVYMKEWDCKYPVFNAGPRLCLGREFAYMSMKCIVANILARYRVKVHPGHLVKPEFGVTLSMKHGLKVTLESRKLPAE